MQNAAHTDHHAIGWRLSHAQRRVLLAQFPPAYPKVVADHVTLAPDVPDDAPLPGDRSGEIIGRVDDEHGVEAMVVRIGGTTERPDGGAYHITWSLDDAQGREAVESNAVIATLGWASLPQSIPILLEPTRLS